MTGMKLKAWDKKKQQWLLWEHLVLMNLVQRVLTQKDRFIPCLYTGSKDIRDVEIYDGDILKVASNGHSNYISFHGSNCYVEYNKDGCRFIATTGNGYDTRNAFDLNCDAEIEVIGNIYENKELLRA